MQVLRTDVVIVGGGAAGCYAALNLDRHGIDGRDRVQGSRRQERRVDLRRQPRAVGPWARQHRGAGPQHRRVSHQIPQPVPDRSALGARLRPVDREGLLSRARGSGPLSAAGRPGQRGHEPGQDPQRRREPARQLRRAVHGLAAQAGHQGRDSPAGGDCRDRAAAPSGRLGVRRVRAQCPHRRVSGRARPCRDPRDRIFRPAACPLDRHARDVRRRHRDGLARRRDPRKPRNAVVAHQRHRRSTLVATHAGLSQSDARLGEVGAHDQFGGRGVLQSAAGRSARLRPLHRPAQGAGKTGARRQGALRRRLLRRLRPLRSARGRGLYELRQGLPPARLALSGGPGRGGRDRALSPGRHRCRHPDHAFLGARPLRSGRARRAQQRADRARDLRRQDGGGRRRGRALATRTCHRAGGRDAA